MTSHTMSTDSLFIWINSKQLIHNTWELLGDIIIHIVMLFPVWCCGIYIKACSASKVIGIILTWNFNVITSSTGIWKNNSKIVFCSMFIHGGLSSCIFIGTGQSRQPIHYSWRRCRSLRCIRNIDRKCHITFIALA